MEHTSSSNGTLTMEKKRSLSPATTEEVRILRMSEYDKAALCLSEAFADDAVARYFVDADDMAHYTEEYKWKLHCDILRYITAAHCYSGLVSSIGPNYDAVALWLGPGQSMDDWWTLLRSGMWRLYYKLSTEGRIRFYSEFLPLLHDTLDDVLGTRSHDCYYLVYLGSKPSARGKGYARKLIEDMSTKADREDRPMYLESSAEANVAYYKKYGFAERKVISLNRGPKPVKLHIMVREPRGGVASLKGGEQTVTIRAL